MGGSSSEEAAELVATIRGEHVVMKKWFNENPSEDAAALRKKYGSYPGLWKEVLNWPGWKESRKAYLKHTQGGGTSTKTEQKETAVPRKRRSRWGNADSNNNNDNNAANKRRSRWGRDNPPASTAPPQGHYGPGPRVPMGLPGLGIPGMPTNLTQQQKMEMGKLQGRLREINVKLENLEAEAARVDALPRGHRERSPSPPPSKFFVSCVESILLR